MHEEVENKRTPPKKPFIFYAVIAFVVIMLLNALVFPSMMKKSVVEVGYDQFLEMIDENQVREVAYDEYSGEFVFIGETENGSQIYKTGIWPEDGQRLLQQLLDHPDIKFSAAIPTQESPLLSIVCRRILLSLDEEKDAEPDAGRNGKRHVLWKIRGKNLCGGRADRGEICGCRGAG